MLDLISVPAFDLESGMKRVRAEGGRFVSEGPIRANNISKVAFLHSRYTKDLPIELA